MINKLTKEQFIITIKQNPTFASYDFDFLYDVYETIIDGIDDMPGFNQYALNQLEIINYILGEYSYTTVNFNEEQLKVFTSDPNRVVSMASLVADKYLSLAMFNFQEKKLMHRFLPPISTLNLYLNFMLNILNGFDKNNPTTTLVSDLLDKSISISRCILSLLVEGYVTEAFATWRTLHECECTLVVLEKYGEPVIKTYLKHMNYAIAYKNGIKDKEKTDEIFKNIKAEMAEHDLKSKDMKKFIEYGWLYAIEDFKEENGYKLNFKDGLENISGVNQYTTFYNLSSEIVHATPILIYSDRNYFYYVTLLTLYESFFRLERSFVNLFSPRVSPEQFQGYLNMRKIYYQHLVELYNREKTIFMNRKK